MLTRPSTLMDLRYVSVLVSSSSSNSTNPITAEHPCKHLRSSSGPAISSQLHAAVAREFQQHRSIFLSSFSKWVALIRREQLTNWTSRTQLLNGSGFAPVDVFSADFFQFVTKLHVFPWTAGVVWAKGTCCCLWTLSIVQEHPTPMDRCRWIHTPSWTDPGIILLKWIMDLLCGKLPMLSNSWGRTQFAKGYSWVLIWSMKDGILD
jgi:hypothetical protein